MSRILVVEDERVIRGEIKRVLAREGHEVAEVDDVLGARDVLGSGFDLILTDLRLPGPNGDVLIEDAQDVPVVVMTAHGSVASAVDSMKRGAVDYLSKPFDPDELALTVKRILTERRLARDHQALRDQVALDWQVDGMVGSSPAMAKVFHRISKVARTDATVLVLGESGTGKELVARAIHAKSDRATGAFVPVNCASIPDGLIESELFGHERGAFTGAVRRSAGLVSGAHEGTLFLDEIGELPLSAQARLLRVLQEREVRSVGAQQTRRVDVRVIAATHRDLPAMVAAGTFREDLYFRLKVVEIALCPLRDRGDDVFELADALLERASRRLGVGPLHFDEVTREALGRYRWPGNVRELANAIERAVILHDDGPIDTELLGLGERPAGAPRAKSPPDATESGAGVGDGVSGTGPAEPAHLSLEEYFVEFVREHEASMSETDLAAALGISRKSLWERRNKLGIPRARK